MTQCVNGFKRRCELLLPFFTCDRDHAYCGRTRTEDLRVRVSQAPVPTDVHVYLY